MSRSYKYPIWKDRTDKRMKRLSNKRVRQWLKTAQVGLKSNNLKKKLTNPWDISDWKIDPKDDKDKQKAMRK